MEGSGRLGGDVAWDASGKRELPEKASHPVAVTADRRVPLAVSAFQPGTGVGPGPAVTGPHHVHRVELAGPDGPVGVGVDEVEPGGRPPVAEQTRFDVFGLQGPVQERVVHQVDLPDRQVVRGAPPSVDYPQLLAVERAGHVGQGVAGADLRSASGATGRVGDGGVADRSRNIDQVDHKLRRLG